MLGKDGKRKSGGEWRRWMWGLFVKRTKRRMVVLESGRRPCAAHRRSCTACMGVVEDVAIFLNLYR